MDIYESIYKNNLARFNELINENGFNVNQRNNGRTLLSYAGLYKRFNMIEELLKIPGINVNSTDAYLWTPLHVAVADNNLDILKKLLQMPGINVNFLNDDGQSPLSLACYQINTHPWPENHELIIHELLQAPGIDVNLSAPPRNITPLMMAVKSGNPNIVQQLLQMPGININAVNSIYRNEGGNTALSMACVLGNIPIINHLLQMPGIDVNTDFPLKRLQRAYHSGIIELDEVEILFHQILETPGLNINQLFTIPLINYSSTILSMVTEPNSYMSDAIVADLIAHGATLPDGSVPAVPAVPVLPTLAPITVRLNPSRLSEPCGICIEAYSSNLPLGILNCNHVFHDQCITNLLPTTTGNRCPKCKVNILNRRQLIIDETPGEFDTTLFLGGSNIFYNKYQKYLNKLP
jgi:hypothetical protein